VLLYYLSLTLSRAPENKIATYFSPEVNGGELFFLEPAGGSELSAGSTFSGCSSKYLSIITSTMFERGRFSRAADLVNFSNKSRLTLAYIAIFSIYHTVYDLIRSDSITFLKNVIDRFKTIRYDLIRFNTIDGRDKR